jgi:membrane-associated protease RseP (regulator of RpoE activity)
VQETAPQEGTTWRERGIALGLFLATAGTVFLSYGWQWLGRMPWSDAAAARDCALYAAGLMSILLAHEMGHYVVARRHQIERSLPYFIPFPMALGTLGAVIRLRSLPRDRNGLLEMGAAGPIAGFVVAIAVMALGLSGTVEHARPELVLEAWPLPALPPMAAAEPSLWDPLLRLLGASDPTESIQLTILANPLLMDLIGELMLGHAPGRYAQLSPLAMAGWAGCFLTGMNLIPIGQLDGGHILNALWPRIAPTVSKIGTVVVIAGGVLWTGWAVWGFLLWQFGATRGIPMTEGGAVSSRARLSFAVCVVAFALSFMVRPIVIDTLTFSEIDVRTEAGVVIDPLAYQRWLRGEETPEATP